MADNDPKHLQQVLHILKLFGSNRRGRELNPAAVAAALNLPPGIIQQLNVMLAKMSVADVRARLQSMNGFDEHTLRQVDAVLSGMPQRAPLTELGLHFKRIFGDEGVLRRSLGPPLKRIAKGTFAFVLAVLICDAFVHNVSNVTNYVAYGRRRRRRTRTTFDWRLVVVICSMVFAMTQAVELAKMAAEAFRAAHAFASDRVIRQSAKAAATQASARGVIQRPSRLVQAWNRLVGRRVADQ